MDSVAYFQNVANQWDSMRQNFFSDAVREKAYAVADVKKGETAADVGAGTGYVTEGLVKRGLKVVAIDRSAEMLEQMKEKFKDFDCIDYRQGEAESLPASNSSVNYAIANMYLHHVEDPLAAIVEMARIIKPGGKLVITDLDQHDFAFLKTEHHDRWMGFERDHVKQWFERAGLKNVMIDCVGENCNSESCCSQGTASISIFIACGEK